MRELGLTYTQAERRRISLRKQAIQPMIDDVENPEVREFVDDLVRENRELRLKNDKLTESLTRDPA